MSLIRCLNNPEGLHVWQDQADTCFLFAGNAEVFSVPSLHFNRIMSKCENEWEGIPMHKLTTGNVISLEEVDSDTGKKGYGKVRLTYNGKYIDMWGVTFFYIYVHWIRQKSSLPSKKRKVH